MWGDSMEARISQLPGYHRCRGIRVKEDEQCLHVASECIIIIIIIMIITYIYKALSVKSLQCFTNVYNIYDTQCTSNNHI